MKKSLEKVLAVMLVMILVVTSNSLAATSTVKLTASKTDVMVGEEFTITVSLEGEEKILTIESLLDYNEDIFELKNKKNEQEGLDLGSGKRLDLAMDNEMQSGNLFTLTFAVKDGVSAQTSEIKLTQIKLIKSDYTDLSVEDQAVSINITQKQTEPEPETPTVTLSKIEISRAPNKVDYTEGEKFSSAGLQINAVYSDGTKKEITNYTYSPNAELKTENKLITFSYEENGVTKSTTQAITVKAKQSNNNNNDNNSDNNNNNNNNNNTNNNGNNSNNQNNNKVANNTTNNTAKNTTNNITNNTTNNATKNTTNNTTNTDASLTNSNLPKTGAETKYILLIVAGLIGVGFVSYIGYRKYKEI